MSSFRTSLILLAFFMTLFMAIMSDSAPAADPVKITVRQGEIVAAGDIHLKDIADVSSGSPAVRKSLEDVFISRAPGAGQYVRISPTTIKLKIARIINGSGYTLDMPQAIKVMSDSAVLHSRDFIRAAENYLKDRNRWLPDLKPSTGSFLPTRNIPAGPLEYRCTVTPGTDDSDPIKISVTAHINKKEIASQDVTFLKSGNSRSRKTTVSGNSGSTGNTSTSSRIRRGDPLKIQFVRKNLTITLEGTAAEAGAPGETIRVTAQDSRKIFKATILDASTAVVEM